LVGVAVATGVAVVVGVLVGVAVEALVVVAVEVAVGVAVAVAVEVGAPVGVGVTQIVSLICTKMLCRSPEVGEMKKWSPSAFSAAAVLLSLSEPGWWLLYGEGGVTVPVAIAANSSGPAKPLGLLPKWMEKISVPASLAASLALRAALIGEVGSLGSPSETKISTS
jgi:hypothetical protein